METTKTTNAATKTEQTTKTTKTEERKEEKTMKTTKTAATNATKTAEQTATPKTDRRADRVRELLKQAKNGSRPEDRKQAAEKAAAIISEFNSVSFANAVNRADMKKAAEALKPTAPKTEERRAAFFAYADPDKVVTFQYMDEEGHENTRRLSLVQYAAATFTKTATPKQAKAYAAALAALEDVTAAAIEGREEHGKAAAAALTELVKACGLDTFTTKTAEDGKKYPFYIDRSFVYAAAAPLRCRKGVVMTAAARLAAAELAALAAAPDRRTKAEDRRAKAEAAAVKAVFGIIAAAAEAAAVNVWKAVTKTAAAVKEDAKKAEAEAAAKAKAKEQAAKAKAAEKAKKEKERAAAAKKKAAEQKKAAAAKAAEQKKTEAKKTAAA